ncbi:MAG TPA: aldo/keto reductase [Stellaceae bacterium]|nr:aldo/keto reductase [Stellaceae bacterium]
MDRSDRIKLNNGLSMPRLGLGVYLSGRGRATENAVGWALEAGYRHVDTAAMYGNETEVGAALKRAFAGGLVRRADVFVTTKLWNSDHGFDEALRAFDASHRRLGLEQIDLFLLHWPVPDRRRQSWRALERILSEGRCRAIGVSNYMVAHLEELLGDATIPPAVNQVELHPWCQQRDVVAFCAAQNIAVVAYSPLTKGMRLADASLAAIARDLGRSPAQILLRWSLQKGFVTIPKSAKKERIVENAAIFDFVLTDRQMAALDGLNEEDHITWDPRQER